MAYSVWHNSVGHTKQSTTRRITSTLHVCCPPLGRRSHRGAEPTRATAIVMVKVPDEAFPIWWRGAPHPPPGPWKYIFELFTGEDSADEWALAAAIFIAQYRRRHSCGPTFREVFEYLLDDTGGVPSRLPREWDLFERRRANGGFRGHVTVDWRRRGYIGFDKQVTRSLRVGPRFREESRRRQFTRKHNVANTSDDQISSLTEARPVDGASLSSSLVDEGSAPLEGPGELALTTDEAIARLHVTSSALKRFRQSGYLHAIDYDGDVRYPAWQFASRLNRPVLPGIDIVATAIPRDWGLVNIAAFMRTPHKDLERDGDRQTPVQWLDCGGDPATVAAILARRRPR